MSRNDTDIQSHSSTPRCPRSEILWSLHSRHDRPSLGNTAQHSVPVNDRRAKLPTGPQIQLAGNSRVVITDTQQHGNRAISRRPRSRSTLQNQDTAQSTRLTYTRGCRAEHIYQKQSHERIQSTGTRPGMLPARPPATTNAFGTMIFGSNAWNRTLPEYAGQVRRTLASKYYSLWPAPSTITSDTLSSGSNRKTRTPERGERKVQKTLASVQQAPARSLPRSNTQRTLPELAGHFIQRTMASVYSLWQAPSALTSFLGSTFCKTMVCWLKQYWSARKSLGICGSSGIV